MKRTGAIAVILFLLSFIIPFSALAEEDEEDPYKIRMNLYEKMEATSQIPWYYFAAIDQYERSIRKARKDIPEENGHIGIFYSPRQWVGPLNPKLDDTNPLSIQLFGGIGSDGNGDNKADPENDEDVLYTLSQYLQSYGTDRRNIKKALWDYYKRDKTVSLIMGNVKIYKEYGLKLDEHAFPLPRRFNYSYKNTWGDPRGWGGRRIHEGTDIFANYGVPVRATSYGVVEIIGWNKYGGWRIGIRDLNNVYHYYAHLRGFEKDIKAGTIVKPGTIIGYVGSSGYGPPGTQGKFPPHLHYGMYKDNGLTEWSFDPFPHLRSWERSDRKKK